MNTNTGPADRGTTDPSGVVPFEYLPQLFGEITGIRKRHSSAMSVMRSPRPCGLNQLVDICTACSRSA